MLKLHWNYNEKPLDGVHWNYTGITLKCHWMDKKKHGPRASVTTKTSAFGLGFCLLSPLGHVFHTAWETMIKSYIISSLFHSSPNHQHHRIVTHSSPNHQHNHITHSFPNHHHIITLSFFPKSSPSSSYHSFFPKSSALSYHSFFPKSSHPRTCFPPPSSSIFRMCYIMHWKCFLRT